MTPKEKLIEKYRRVCEELGNDAEDIERNIARFLRKRLSIEAISNEIDSKNYDLEKANKAKARENFFNTSLGAGLKKHYMSRLKGNSNKLENTRSEAVSAVQKYFETELPEITGYEVADVTSNAFIEDKRVFLKNIETGSTEITIEFEDTTDKVKVYINVSARGSVCADIDNSDKHYYITIGKLFGETEKLVKLCESILRPYSEKVNSINDETRRIEAWLSNPCF